MNTKLHAICDSQGRPIDLFVTAGQVSDYIGARVLLSGLPKVDWLLGDRGHDADWFVKAVLERPQQAQNSLCPFSACHRNPTGADEGRIRCTPPR